MERVEQVNVKVAACANHSSLGTVKIERDRRTARLNHEWRCRKVEDIFAGRGGVDFDFNVTGRHRQPIDSDERHAACRGLQRGPIFRGIRFERGDRQSEVHVGRLQAKCVAGAAVQADERRNIRRTDQQQIDRFRRIRRGRATGRPGARFNEFPLCLVDVKGADRLEEVADLNVERPLHARDWPAAAIQIERQLVVVRRAGPNFDREVREIEERSVDRGPSHFNGQTRPCNPQLISADKARFIGRRGHRQPFSIRRVINLLSSKRDSKLGIAERQSDRVRRPGMQTGERAQVLAADRQQLHVDRISLTEHMHLTLLAAECNVPFNGQKLRDGDRDMSARFGEFARGTVHGERDRLGPRRDHERLRDVIDNEFVLGDSRNDIGLADDGLHEFWRDACGGLRDIEVGDVLSGK